MKNEIVDIDEIIDVIIAYAKGDFEKRLNISKKRDERDSIVAGINMLGEELEKTTISRDYFMNIYHSVSEILMILDMDGIIIDVNSATEKAFNKTLAQLKGRDFLSLISPSYIQVKNVMMNRVIKGDSYVSFEVALLTAKKKELPVTAILSEIIHKNGNQKGCLFIAKDITHIKDKEKNDLRIAISSIEKERKRLAADLHDALGQELNAIKMYVNTLSIMNPQSPDYKKSFDLCKGIIDNTVETIRNISFDLLPKSLEQGGLVAAINEFVFKYEKICHLVYNYPKFNIQLNEEDSINIYRTLQEFVNNSVKHSEKKKLIIKITKSKNMVTILLQDDGKGFNIKTAKRGSGIYNIEGRLKTSNINYIYESKKNVGTKLELYIPQGEKRT